MDRNEPTKKNIPKAGALSGSAENHSAPATCPECGKPMSEGICLHCESSADEDDRTYVQKDLPDLATLRSLSIGEADLDSQTPITLEIQGKHLTLPMAEIITLGRAVKRPFARQPDVDLSPFEGASKSISRRHVELRRRNTGVYVTDLGSANGTWLNGHRLLPKAERLLRNGDELRLGHLTIKVKYYAYPQKRTATDDLSTSKPKK
jgi:hypothetical protein